MFRTHSPATASTTAAATTALAILAALILLLPAAAHAFSAYGHQAIAELACRHLTPAARAAADELIAPYTLADFTICSWPDFVRGDPEIERQYPHNQTWHFIDFDANTPYREGTPFVLKNPVAGDDHIAAQIPRFAAILADTGRSRSDRFDALRFLVHFVGDLHQPFHCIDRNHDVGANFIPVNSFSGHYANNTARDAAAVGERLCLHSVWDDEMVAELREGRPYLFSLVLSLDARLPRRLARSWLVGTARDWAVESYWIARRDGYYYTDGTPIPDRRTPPGLNLTCENYIDSHLPLARLQLQRAGIRLAHLINTALDPSYAPDALPLPDPFQNTTPAPWINTALPEGTPPAYSGPESPATLSEPIAPASTTSP